MHLQASYKQRGSTILAIDDVPSNLDVLVAHLHEEEVDLIVALSGEEGLELAQTTNPDLILLDVMMPGMNGFETCEKLKANPSTADIPILFLTAKDDEQDIEKGLALGAVDYIAKPFSIPILKARMQNHLNFKRSNDLLNHLSLLEAKSNIANADRLEWSIQREWLRARRHKQPLSIILIELLTLTANNQAAAQQAYQLASLADKLAAVLKRPCDLVAHITPAKFAVLLPETDFEHAGTLAQQLQQIILHTALDAHATDSNNITGLGVVTSIPSNLADFPLLMESARFALLVAKNKGANTITKLEIGQTTHLNECI